MRNAGLEEAQAGIKIAGRNISQLTFRDFKRAYAKYKYKTGHTAGLSLPPNSESSDPLFDSDRSTLSGQTLTPGQGPE